MPIASGIPVALKSSFSKAAWPHLHPKPSVSTTSVCSEASEGTATGYTLLLEEAKGRPVFWSGTEVVAKLVWKLRPNDINDNPRTISQVMEKFVAQEFIRHCHVSLATPEPVRVPAPIRMSDPLESLWKDGRGRMVKLILDPVYKSADPADTLTKKYVLVMSEMNKKKVLWDGKSATTTMVARIDEQSMLTPVENILKKYLPTDYLRKSGLRMRLVMNKNTEESTREIRLKDVIGTIFKDKAAAIRFWIEPLNSAKSSGTSLSLRPSKKVKSSDGKDAEDSLTETRSIESFWLHGNWYEIREKVQYLLEALEVYRKEREIPKDVDDKLLEEKSSLESSMRRRNRSIDEVWNRYESLKNSVDVVLALPQRLQRTVNWEQPITREPPTNPNNRRPAPPSEACDPFNPPVTRLTTNSPSCVDIVAHHLRSVGLEMYDENQRVTPAAGVAFTIAVVVVVCVLSSYLSR